ncbi:Uncharacterized protein FWK35_00003557, partial [Aphis craccivora]
MDIFLDSERSDKCIDFTMIITSQNNAPNSNFGGGFRCKSEYPWCIIEVKSKHFPTVFKKIEKKKKKRKTGIFTQNQFSTKSIFLYGCNSKTNNCKYLKFPSNIKFLRNMSKMLKFAKLKRNDNDLSSNDFKYFISRRYLTILPNT